MPLAIWTESDGTSSWRYFVQAMLLFPSGRRNCLHLQYPLGYPGCPEPPHSYPGVGIQAGPGSCLRRLPWVLPGGSLVDIGADALVPLVVESRLNRGTCLIAPAWLLPNGNRFQVKSRWSTPQDLSPSSR